MEPGYLLDYVYSMVPSRPDGTPEPDPIGGSPRLYARVADQEPLTACTDDIDPAAYLRHIRTDGSEEGFFQLAVREILAEQFYLFWHAHSDDDRVVCTREAIEAALRGESPLGDPFSPEQKAAARGIDTTPVVDLGEDRVTVKFVSFTKWGGFFRRTYELSRTFPHAPLVRRKEQLVEYQIGIIF